MCEFISWIEYNGRLYYLTDSEIFSDDGKIKLAGCKDNDFLGHGAIIKYYGLEKAKNQGKLVEMENRDFWKENIPAELAEKIKNFDKNWGKTWKKYFMNDDLCYIIRYCPEFAERAWVHLLPQTPSNYDLCYIIENCPAFADRASEHLLTQNPSNYNLRYIILNCPAFADRARKILQKNKIKEGL